MKKYFSVLFVLVAVLALMPGSGTAGTASTSLNVSVVVDGACTMSSTPVTFSDYLQLGTNQAAPDDGTGTLVVTCTAGVSPTIGLSLGGYSQGSQARMSNGVTGFLNYNLYQDASRTVAWGNSAPNLLSMGTVQNTSPQTVTVYGRIPAGQTPPGGTYSDVVQATLNF
jgi:spore coat protein U-like protein